MYPLITVIKCNMYSKTPWINNVQCRSVPVNADQNHGIDPKFLSMLINSDQLIGIDRH